MIGYGDYIKRHRLASGYRSQRRLAEKSGISAATISRIEKEIQKPEARTLKTLAQYLHTTSYVELMVVCGYWDKEELLDEEMLAEDPIKNNQIQGSKDNEKDLAKKIDLSDEELLKQFNLMIDGRSLTEEEAKGILAYIRASRQMEN